MNAPRNRWLLGAWGLAALISWSAMAQTPQAPPGPTSLTADLLAARGEVIADLVRSLPANLPEGALAVLPPEIVDRNAVEAVAAESWTTAMAEALHAARPALRIADRAALEAVLREQKLGDSAYADPKSAVQVGKLVAARTLLMTRLHELRLRRGRVVVALEASLVDVQSGENLWSRAERRGLFPLWAKLAIAGVILILMAAAWSFWRRARHQQLVTTELPRAKQEVRIDVDGLARAATDARERARAAGQPEVAAELQKAWVDLDAALDRVRHALPGGSVDRSSVRDLAGALVEAERIGTLVEDLRNDCTRAGTGPSNIRDLAPTLRTGAGEVRIAVDRYRKHLP